MTILIVDDELDLCQCLQVFLEQQGCRVWMASTGREALALLRAHRPDVLLLDLSLGRGAMSGTEVLRQSRVLSPDTRIVVISGTADDATIAEVLALGAADYLTKPHSAQAVLRAIRAVAGA